ncbi:hypothetical protein D6851_02475 [Altericroceibacterium spongiae]|uniref:Helix-turn-helix domain-containing protein n=1 Tax=Altericroceibacterium spongiae TaxID=2320269 RepID=A0A420ERM5_9SPHN|nr:helix-turn-helix transcriptional regulator [Altericroceibacterium spongiae]RKF23356.1 hypothetical protein D6851_02475 [Altericroceibacterium spongiae]
MEKLTSREIRKATGISQSYASMIANGRRTPPRALAIYLLRQTGWRHPSIADLTDKQIDVLESVEPWQLSKPDDDDVAAARSKPDWALSDAEIEALPENRTVLCAVCETRLDSAAAQACTFVDCPHASLTAEEAA